MIVDKSCRGEAGITGAADISGTQTRINFQFALLFLSSGLSQQLGSSKRQIKAGRWALIFQRGFVWNGSNTKPEAAFDVARRPTVRPAALDARLPGPRVNVLQRRTVLWRTVQMFHRVSLTGSASDSAVTSLAAETCWCSDGCVPDVTAAGWRKTRWTWSRSLRLACARYQRRRFFPRHITFHFPAETIEMSCLWAKWTHGKRPSVLKNGWFYLFWVMRYTTKTVCKESKDKNVGKHVFCRQNNRSKESNIHATEDGFKLARTRPPKCHRYFKCNSILLI